MKNRTKVHAMEMTADNEQNTTHCKALRPSCWEERALVGECGRNCNYVDFSDVKLTQLSGLQKAASTPVSTLKDVRVIRHLLRT